MLHAEGRGVERDQRRAAEWLLLAAEQGLASAQHDLGLLALRGAGAAPDPHEAERWLRAAAEQGLVRAQLRLGMLHATGVTGTTDDVRAYAWYTLAAAQGDATASAMRAELSKGMPLSRTARGEALAREWSGRAGWPTAR